MNIELAITGITEQSKREKLIKAAHALSDQMGLGAKIEYPLMEKGNPNHDQLGRFAEGETSTKESWDSSTEKAKELKAEDWGTPEEIAEMAKMPRQAKSRDEARTILNELKNQGTLKNKKDKRLEATLSKDSIKKLVDDKALYTSFDREAHWIAVANVDKLYANAIEPWKFELNPNKNNQDLKERRVLYSPMKFRGSIIPIKLTVKEFKDSTRGIRLYTVEAIDVILVEKEKDAGQQRDGVLEKSGSLSLPARRPSFNNIDHIFDSVNGYLRKSRITYPDIEVFIQNITPQNRKAKFIKAIRAVSKALNVPVAIERKHSREPYFYPVQQELADYWAAFYKRILSTIYTVVTTALGLPKVEVETLRKAIDDGLLRYDGKVLYSPETGEPIKQKDFDALIQAIEKFLNRKTKETGKRIVLDAVAIGKLLRRMAKYQTTKDMEALTLDTMKYRGKTFDWIREDMKNIQEAFRLDGREMSRAEIARYQVAQDYVAQKVTRVNNDIKDEIKEVILNGIVEKRSKSQVSQDLFNRLGALNRDWKQINDTEQANTENLTGILEEVRAAPEGEKIYFQRYELAGCCPKCKEVDGKVVLWSDTPLADDKIEDEFTDTAIWVGKEWKKGKTTLVPGTLHPNCRGGWLRWGGKKVDAMMAKVYERANAWDDSVKQAREEFQRKGIENPNDQTLGYTERINEIYREKEGTSHSSQVNPSNDARAEAEAPQGAETISAHRKNLEATRLAYEQAHKEWDLTGKPKNNRGLDIGFFDRLDELYFKHCAELGVEPERSARSQEERAELEEFLNKQKKSKKR